MKFIGYISYNESDFQSYYLAVTEELKKMKDVNIQKKQDCISFTTDSFVWGTTSDAFLKYAQGKVIFDRKKKIIEFSFNNFSSIKITIAIIIGIIFLSIFLFWQIIFAIIPLGIQEVIHYYVLKKNFKIFIENIEKRVNEQKKHENLC